MCRIRSCCCCLNLRQGCYLAVVYSMLVGGLAVFLNVMIMQHMDITSEIIRRQKGFSEQEINQKKSGAKIILYISLGLLAAWVLTALFIVCGIKSGVRGFLLPWIVITAVLMGVAAYNVGTKLLIIMNVIKDVYQLAYFVTDAVIFLCNIYAVICVAAFYRNNLMLEEDEYIPEAVPMKGDAYYGPDAV